MNIKIDFEELDEVRRITDKNKEELGYEIDRLLKSLERLKNIWQGEDFDKFYDNAYNYINRMKILCKFMETTNEFMESVENSYREQDGEFSNSLKEEEAKLDGKNSNN